MNNDPTIQNEADIYTKPTRKRCRCCGRFKSNQSATSKVPKFNAQKQERLFAQVVQAELAEKRHAEKMQRIKDREEYMHVIPPDRANRPMSELEENYYRQIAAFRKTSKQERAELFKGWNSRPLPNV